MDGGVHVHGERVTDALNADAPNLYLSIAGTGDTITLHNWFSVYYKDMEGDVVEEVLAFARRHCADGVVTTSAVDPRFAGLHQRIAAQLPVQLLEPEPFVELPEPVDLRRFSRYWRRAEPVLWGRRAGAGAPPAPVRRWDR